MKNLNITNPTLSQEEIKKRGKIIIFVEYEKQMNIIFKYDFNNISRLPNELYPKIQTDYAVYFNKLLFCDNYELLEEQLKNQLKNIDNFKDLKKLSIDDENKINIKILFKIINNNIEQVQEIESKIKQIVLIMTNVNLNNTSYITNKNKIKINFRKKYMYFYKYCQQNTIELTRK